MCEKKMKAHGSRFVSGVSRLLALIALGSLMVLHATAVIWAQTRNGAGNFLDLENGRIYYEECGTGDSAVVLVHDGVLDSGVWDHVWPAFCKDFHTIRYDRRGYGRSPAATSWYMETDDLFALLRHLKVHRAMLVGSSHGGELSIEFTLEHPNVVEQLVLVGAVVHGYPFSDHFLNRGERTWAPPKKTDVAGAIAKITDDRYLTAPDHSAAHQKIRDLLTAAPQDFTHGDMARDLPSSLPRLHEIHVPTLILVGDADVPDVHAHAGAIETGIPNSRRIVVADAGHLMYLEKPDEFVRIVVRFLKTNSD
jgi:pimeloyl-ACP methyl ester carboxylesterase